MAAPESGKEEGSSSGGSFSLGSIQADAAKAWDSKVAAANKAWDDQVKAVTDSAEAALDAGISKVSQVVRSGVAEVSRETSAAKTRAEQFYQTGVAHYEATEEQALALFRRGVRCIAVDYRQESIAAGVVAAAVLLPGPRRFLFRHTLGRFRSEEAMFRSAESRYATLRDRVEAQHGELQTLQERLKAAEGEYARSLSNLRSAASDLQGLSSRVHSSSKAANALVRDLRELPSKAALQLRSDAANTAAVAGNQSAAVQKFVKRIAKQYGI
ncbi:Uncharacterized conserved UCP022280 [Chlorella sorokiniana]|uniref:Uncharacterized conserved UCP022280 n=1 Tax=Chlorella sorokiniana TaxID=3076 RepID=A0A2P6TSU5_CHLSO|nr:Uncharacterized conserved UCP022280 [Chlorella sorokiniana]|eukprot:PRW57141.1 Uncharacterized conserved UCP022280 [Chlorella sorokiniana]